MPAKLSYTKPNFFEGASIPKINHLYYFVYSATDNSGLNYCTSKYPDRDFTYRGRIHSTSDIGINGHKLMNAAYPIGNNHGGLVCVKGQWYIFNHRMTNQTYFSRQGVAEPITIEADGTIRQVEATSCGLNGGPLKGEGAYPAYIACNLMDKKIFGMRNPMKGPYMTQDGENRECQSGQYLTGMKDGCIAGYKYFDFNKES